MTWVHIALWFLLAMLIWYILPLVSGSHFNSLFFTLMSKKAMRNLKPVSEYVSSLLRYWIYTIGFDTQIGHVHSSSLLVNRGTDMGLAKPPRLTKRNQDQTCCVWARRGKRFYRNLDRHETQYIRLRQAISHREYPRILWEFWLLWSLSAHQRCQRKQCLVYSSNNSSTMLPDFVKRKWVHAVEKKKMWKINFVAQFLVLKYE